MVSTRRMAQKEPENDTEAAATLKKKPLRKAAVKGAEETGTATATKRATRTRNTPIETSTTTDPKSAEATSAVQRIVKTTTKAKEQPSTTRKISTTRPPTQTANRASRSTRSGKLQDIGGSVTPDLEATSSSQPARSRRTASTRARPLSPKKITQVSRSQPRSTRAVATGAKGKKAPQAPAAGNKDRRQRIESDENEDVIIVKQRHRKSEDRQGDVPSAGPSPTTGDENRSIITTQPACHASSPIQTASKIEDEMMSEIIGQTTEPEQGGSNNSEQPSSMRRSLIELASEDELCGPSTPMKRSCVSTHASLVDFTCGDGSDTHQCSSTKPVHGPVMSPPVDAACDSPMPIPPTITRRAPAGQDEAHTTIGVLAEIEDPDETIIMHDLDDRDAEASVESTGSALVPGPNVVDLNTDTLGASQTTESARPSSSREMLPETMIWENLTQDDTLRLDSKTNLAQLPMLSDIDQTELLENAASSGETCAVDVDMSPQISHIQRNQACLEGPADGTINLTDFIEPAALVGSVQSLRTISTPIESWQQKPEMTPIACIRKMLSETRNSNDLILDTPRYARAAFAFGTRRRSVPVLGLQTPARVDKRPHTAEGKCIHHTVQASKRQWQAPVGLMDRTPIPIRTPSRPRAGRNTSPDRVSLHDSPQRQSVRPQRMNGVKTAAMPSRFRTPVATPVRFSGSTRKRFDVHKSPRFSTGRPQSEDASQQRGFRKASDETSAESCMDSTSHSRTASRVTTPIIESPLRQRMRHAVTIAGPKRFKTPSLRSSLRGGSVQRAITLRKVAFGDIATPTRVPVKFECMTPSAMPMTPHPSAPLKGVVALVEVYTLEGASASAPFIAQLQRLGARTTKSWSDRITHVIFKDGSPTTLQRIRLHNKDVVESGTGQLLSCVGTRWVVDCDENGARLEESMYAIDTDDIPRGGKRRRQSMEPGVLHNVGGNVVRDRKSSSTLSRTPKSFGSSLQETPAEKGVATPDMAVAERNSRDQDDLSSPDTPAWLHPENLVQQTLPLKRVRKLDLKSKEKRRLTCWPTIQDEDV